MSEGIKETGEHYFSIIWHYAETLKIQTKGKKWGNQGYYHGVRLEFLQEKALEFTALPARDYPQFWPSLYASWWEQFPWCLRDNEDPPKDAEGLQELGAAPADEEEAARKSKVEEETKKARIYCHLALQHWFLMSM
jgi:hypothetical protein